jgi:[acyl-carrier-protein] S-malonyltransferase
MQVATEKGAKRAIKLPVSAPFHCSLMQPAATIMKQALDKVPARDAEISVVTNITALPLKEVDLIKSFLVEQVTGRVRWRESIMNLASLGVTTVVEIGAGKVLTGLVKRIDPNLEALTLNTPADMAAVLQKL